MRCGLSYLSYARLSNDNNDERERRKKKRFAEKETRACFLLQHRAILAFSTSAARILKEDFCVGVGVGDAWEL